MRSTKIAIGFGAVLVVLGLLTGVLQFEHGNAYADTPTGSDDVAALRQMSDAFERVSAAVTPSVVNISATKKIRNDVQGRGSLRDSPFRDFFGDDFFERFFDSRGGGREQVQQGLGTGVIIDNAGHILTNNHVVDGADQLLVRLSDDRSFDAKVVGTDPKTDLAVLRIDAKDLQPARLGNSDDLKIGQWVLAVGNPFGLSSSITAGIVSAKGRANVGLADYEDFIQTDAAINPGNSGGPLVNLDGEVVGINTAIVTRSGGYMGVGFAIPVNMARSISSSLMAEGRVVRGWLGVLIQQLDEGLAKSFGYDKKKGVLIGDVTPDGPAAKADLRAGDIIVRYEGEPVDSMADLRARVAATKPGSRVKIEVFRDGHAETVTVEIGELEARVAVAGDSQPDTHDLGMTVTTLTPELADAVGQGERVRGVLVRDVDPLGPGARAGLRSRDVIVTVQGKPVESVAQFRDRLGELNLEQGVRLGVRRGSTQRFVFVRATGPS